MKIPGQTIGTFPTLGFAWVHFLGALVLFHFFLAQSPSQEYIGFLNAYIAKARGMFYEFFGFRAMLLAVIIGAGAMAVSGLLGILPDRPRLEKLLKGLAVAMAAYAFLMMLGYLANPNYIDPGESHVTMLSLLVKEGKPVYSVLDNPDLANTWYGPVLFLVNAVFLSVIPDPILATKLRGIVGLLAGLWFFHLFLSRRHGTPLSYVATSYVILCLYLSFYFAIGNRADSLIICFTLLAAGFSTFADTRKGMWITAACIAAAVNCKVTAAAYMFPIGAYMVETHGWRPALRTTGLSMLLFFSPFLVFPLFPLHHYLSYISMATSHRFETPLLWENIGFAAFISLPLAWVLYPAFRDKADVRVPAMRMAGFTVLGIALVCLSASKEGSGFYHLLAFSPGLALLWIHSASKEGSLAPGNASGVLAASWMYACLLLVMGNHLGLLYGFKLRGNHNPGEEIRAIVKEFPGERIAMGYGSSDDYGDTRLFYRPLLFNTTRDNPMNAVTMMEIISAGKPIPPLSCERFGNGHYDLFLIPAGGEPFSASIFEDTGIQALFRENYEKIGSREFFEVWRWKGAKAS